MRTSEDTTEPACQMQLDIFEHSREVMLRNDVIDAVLGAHTDATSTDATTAATAATATATAATAMRRLATEYPGDEALPDLALLLGAIAGPAHDAFADHAAARLARLALTGEIEPAAQRRLGQPVCEAWLRSLWRDQARRAAGLGFAAEHGDEHAAPLWLRAADWRAAADAVAAIGSWRRIPAPLGWMAEARFHLYGLDSVWPLLAELAWLAPERLAQVLDRIGDTRLQRLRKRFDADFEPAPDAAADAGWTSAASASASDLAWFPAWLLIEQPALAALLSQAQPGNDRRPERALRLMVALLVLEQQGRHHDIVQRRKDLRELHPGLYRTYLKTR